MNNKGQAALEFLMTYGWTILAAIVSIAAFAQFGIVSGGTFEALTGATVCVLPPGLACEYKIGSNGIQLALTNGFHERIVDVTVRVISTEIGNCSPSSPTSINVGETKHIFVDCPHIGNAKRFRGDLEVSYRFESQSITHTDTGSISGSIEEGTVCVDADNDGFGVGGCDGAIDCDDSDPAINPGPNQPEGENPEQITCETCQDSKDNDCDGFTDSYDSDCENACNGQQTCEDPDLDDDTYNDVVCGGNDCNDDPITGPAIHPPPEHESTVAMCRDEIDNDCDTRIDSEIINPNNPDESCDGLGCGEGNDEDGDEHYAIGSCIGNNVDDCDDDNPVVHGGMPEICGDKLDNNCNGQTDETPCEPCIPICDQDQDDYCSSQEPCNGNDCDDTNPNVNPGVEDELECSDALDNDCDGQIDCSDLCCRGQGQAGSPIFSPLLKIDCANQCL